MGLSQLQPWVLALMELPDEEHQAILISHHAEILNHASGESGYYLWRDNHTSPTRIGPLRVPEGISAREAITRGWVDAWSNLRGASREALPERLTSARIAALPRVVLPELARIGRTDAGLVGASGG